ncbi:hypothetical protein AMATHDRAFT_1425 [Amanita thiersii Skay4041]|uniref:Mid2 domain-containing protein n=1 Tax=Amanita thiersii Skay4041 TaxID=703135 RepID=A0A2A9NY41_9AGAR|nr:hypothetical protein AMATHDRAFT_1425 [Amanita thiersii Skay4041]
MAKKFPCFLGLILSLPPHSFGSSFGLRFNISKVTQCEPVSITFTSKPDKQNAPKSLTLLASDYRLQHIDLGVLDPDALGFNLTSIPFPAYTTFLASLDNIEGIPIAPVSDLISVYPSGDTTCLPIISQSFSPGALLDTGHTLAGPISTISPSDSEPNASQVIPIYQPGHTPPRVLDSGIADSVAFDGSILLLETADNTKNGLVSQSVSLASSHMPRDIHSDNGSNNDTMKRKGHQNSKIPDNNRVPIIIGCTIGAVVIFIVALLMVVFVVRERRRNKRVEKMFTPAVISNTSLIDHRRSKSLPADPDIMENGVKNPPYVTEVDLYSSLKSRSTKASSIATTITNSFGHIQQLSEEANNIKIGPAKDIDHEGIRSFSVTSMDIEGMLNMATIPSFESGRILGPPSRQSVPHSLAIDSMDEDRFKTITQHAFMKRDSHLLVPPPSVYNAARRHTPLDVPKDFSPTRSSFTSAPPNDMGENTYSSSTHMKVNSMDGSVRSAGSSLNEESVSKQVAPLFEAENVPAHRKVSFADGISGQDKERKVEKRKYVGLPANPKSRVMSPFPSDLGLPSPDASSDVSVDELGPTTVHDRRVSTASSAGGMYWMAQ